MPKHLFTRRAYGLAIIAITAGFGRAEAQAAEIFWTSEPVKPGQTVQFNGMDLDKIRKANVVRLNDDDSKAGHDTALPLSPSLQTEKTLSYRLPTSLGDGIFAVTLEDETGKTITTQVNSADLYWMQGDAGDSATIGGWLRLQGRNIARTASAILELTTDDGTATRLSPDSPDPWTARFAVPKTMGAGHYKARLWNGNGDDTTWKNIGSIDITRPSAKASAQMELRSIPTDAPSVDDTDRINASLTALANRGGGTLLLRAGIYHLAGTLKIPDGVTLRGQSRDSVSLFWKDMDQPPSALIKGYRNFAVENLTINAQRHLDIIQGGKDESTGQWTGENIQIHGVTIRALALLGHLTPEEAASRIKAMSKVDRDGVAGLRLGGNNISVANCDVLTTQRSIVLTTASNGVVSDNVFRNGRTGWYGISGSNRILFENNRIMALDLEGTGGGVNTLHGFPSSRDVLVRDNTFSNIYGWDREAMTSDGPGGYYTGQIAAVGPDKVALVGAIDDKAKTADWSGAGLYIVKGHGTGMAAHVGQISGNVLTLDRDLAPYLGDDSVVTITNSQENYLLVNNDFQDTGALQIFGVGYKHVIAGNKTERSAGIYVTSLNYRHLQPIFFTQVEDNQIGEPDITGRTRISITGRQFAGNTSILSLGIVIRGNTLTSNAKIEIDGRSAAAPAVEGVLVEDNKLSQTDIGIEIKPGVRNLLMNNNTSKDVRMSIKGTAQN